MIAWNGWVAHNHMFNNGTIWLCAWIVIKNSTPWNVILNQHFERFFCFHCAFFCGTDLRHSNRILNQLIKNIRNDWIGVCICFLWTLFQKWYITGLHECDIDNNNKFAVHLVRKRGKFIKIAYYFGDAWIYLWSGIRVENNWHFANSFSYFCRRIIQMAIKINAFESLSTKTMSIWGFEHFFHLNYCILPDIPNFCRILFCIYSFFFMAKKVAFCGTCEFIVFFFIGFMNKICAEQKNMLPVQQNWTGCKQRKCCIKLENIYLKNML